VRLQRCKSFTFMFREISKNNLGCLLQAMGIDCEHDPDSDCNLFCETQNPNPDLYWYVGGICEVEAVASKVCGCFCVPKNG
jgi:hypothetical protein